jgi:hypothetical protein
MQHRTCLTRAQVDEATTNANLTLDGSVTGGIAPIATLASFRNLADTSQCVRATCPRPRPTITQ